MNKEEYVSVTFVETMIDHLDLKSKIIEVETEEGREQVKKFGIPEPLLGKKEKIKFMKSLTLTLLTWPLDGD